MEARCDRKQNPTDWVISPPDEIHPNLTGDGTCALAAHFAPKPSETRHMLLALRKGLRWSQSFAAMVLGVTPGAIVKWEAGDRDPNGAAAKLIFLLHSLFVDSSSKVKNAWDLAFWGRIPCRGTVQQLIEISRTYFVPREVVLRHISEAQQALSHQGGQPSGAADAKSDQAKSGETT